MSAKLENADLRDADLSVATLDHAWLSGANLGRARLDGASCRHVGFLKTNLDDSSATDVDFGESQLRPRRCAGLIFGARRFTVRRSATATLRVPTFAEPTYRIAPSNRRPGPYSRARWLQTRRSGRSTSIRPSTGSRSATTPNACSAARIRRHAGQPACCRERARFGREMIGECSAVGIHLSSGGMSTVGLVSGSV